MTKMQIVELKLEFLLTREKILTNIELKIYRCLKLSLQDPSIILTFCKGSFTNWYTFNII